MGHGNRERSQDWHRAKAAVEGAFLESLRNVWDVREPNENRGWVIGVAVIYGKEPEAALLRHAYFMKQAKEGGWSTSLEVGPAPTDLDEIRDYIDALQRLQGAAARLPDRLVRAGVLSRSEADELRADP